MTSQSSQAFVRHPMPLEKFSFATVAADSCGPVPWTHWTSRNDLFAVLETSEVQNIAGALEKHNRLKVLRDPEIMEDIDLDVLALASQRMNDALEAKSCPQNHQSITIIVKLPCLAIRYPTSGGRIRKFQIRFTVHSDYEEAVNKLVQCRIPFTDAGSGHGGTFVQTNHSKTTYAESQAYSAGRDFSMKQYHEHTQLTNQPTFGPPQLAVETLNQNQYLDIMKTKELTPERLSTNSAGARMPDYLMRMRCPSQPHSRTLVQSSSQPHQSLPNIDLDHYGIRPSTAPVNYTTCTVDDMPPRRELPFDRQKRSTGTSLVQQDQQVPSQSTEQTKAQKTYSELTARPQPERISNSGSSSAHLHGRDGIHTADESVPEKLRGEEPSVRHHRQLRPATQIARSTELIQQEDAILKKPSLGAEADSQALFTRAESKMVAEAHSRAEASVVDPITAHDLQFLEPLVAQSYQSPFLEQKLPSARQTRSRSRIGLTNTTSVTDLLGSERSSAQALRPRKCTRCVRKKLTCDKKSRCSNCIAADADCIDPGPRKRRKATDNMRSVAAIQSPKITRLQSTLVNQLCRASPTPTTAPVHPSQAPHIPAAQHRDVQTGTNQAESLAHRPDIIRPASSDVTSPSAVETCARLPSPSSLRPDTQNGDGDTTAKNNAAAALVALLRDPSFAPAPNRAPALVAETGLVSARDQNSSTTTPPHPFAAFDETARRQALETWMCQQFHDEGFLTLCRDLEGMWTRLFVQF